MPNCLRCHDELDQAGPQTPGISFFLCPHCGSQYAQEPGQGLHDRWLMPLSLPLNGVIFEKDPVAHARAMAAEFAGRSDLDLDVLARHVDRELSSPTQRVSEIHHFEHATVDTAQLQEVMRAP